MKTIKINELISKLKEYDGELTVKVWSNGKTYPISNVAAGTMCAYIGIDDRNLVVLSKIWHDASEEPTTEPTRVLATDEKGFIDVFSLEKGKFKLPNGCIPWSSIVFCFNLTKWAYISDLLPKGGAK